MAETNISCLVEESLGKQWYFSLTDQQIIEFTRKEEDTWAKPAQLDGEPVKHFKVAIDKDDSIHLLAYSTSKKLIYYEWNGVQWYHRLLYRIQSRFENISHLEVLATLNQVHIFYYIENALKRAQESLVHSWFENGKWQSNVLLNFLTDQRVKLQIIQHDTKGNLFGIYTRLLRNESRCYFIYYDTEHRSWSKPFILFQQPGICSNFKGYADSNGDFHIIWVEKAGSEYRLNYKKIIPTTLNSNTETFCIMDNGALPIDATCLHNVGNALYCCWIQDGRALISQGDISKMHWDQSKEIARGPFQIYRKISKTVDGNSHVEIKIGDGYPEFSWTLKSLVLGEQSKEKKPVKKVDDTNLSRDKHPNNSYLLIEDQMKEQNDQILYRSIDEIQQSVSKFQSKIKEINSRIDDFHAALYQLQDYIRQKDKNSFQRDAQIRKLAFEIEQIRVMRTNIPMIDSIKSEDEDKKNSMEPEQHVPVQDNDMQQKKELPKNVDSGSGEIQLGNVNILINPEEEPENED